MIPGGPRLDCPTVLRDGMAFVGVDVTVSLAPPILGSPWEPFTCPHGTHYWLAPTTAQRARGRLAEAAP